MRPLGVEWDTAAVETELLLSAIPEMVRGDVRGALHDRMTDDRSVLVLEPLRWVLALTPQWTAWEQVPTVLPIWQECAKVLRRIGYTVTTGVLRAEQYGVPQTRRRAVLVARSAVFSRTHGQARLAEPTHSRFYSHKPGQLDMGVSPWLSMAQALGWGMTARPYPTVAGGTAAGGQDPQMLGGSGARDAVRRELEAGRWIPRVMAASGTSCQIVDPRPVSHPAPTITAAGNAEWGVRPTRAPGRQARDPLGVRVSVAEAAVLQSFPVDYPWQGNLTAQFRQVGDAVPPMLARAVVSEVAAVTRAATPALTEGEVAA
jgi:DNA (cytosine-5)-methyltransferase 1